MEINLRDLAVGPGIMATLKSGFERAYFLAETQKLGESTDTAFIRLSQQCLVETERFSRGTARFTELVDLAKQMDAEGTSTGVMTAYRLVQEEIGKLHIEARAASSPQVSSSEE